MCGQTHPVSQSVPHNIVSCSSMDACEERKSSTQTQITQAQQETSHSALELAVLCLKLKVFGLQNASSFRLKHHKNFVGP